MKNLLTIAALFLFLSSCDKSKENKNTVSSNKIPVYAWDVYRKSHSDTEIKEHFEDLKSKGIVGLMYSAGHDPEVYSRIGKMAKSSGLEFHAWIPTMIQQENPKLKREWYAVNRNGDSSFDKPAYIPRYKFLCPSMEENYQFLEELYGSVAAIEEVDGIHLDFIRFPDVILPVGLWEKYGLVMDKEYPEYDYCYCSICTNGFLEEYGIDIHSVDDPTQVEEWRQYRYDLITKIVNRLSDVVHSKSKQINAAVFPGPNSVAKKLVRQEWDKWNLDAFYPMNYNDFYLEGTDWIGSVTLEAVNSLDNNKPVYSGLYICPDPENKANEKDPENHGLLPGELEAAIRNSMTNGASGICLFTPYRMTDEHWNVLIQTINNQSENINNP